MSVPFWTRLRYNLRRGDLPKMCKCGAMMRPPANIAEAMTIGPNGWFCDPCCDRRMAEFEAIAALREDYNATLTDGEDR